MAPHTDVRHEAGARRVGSTLADQIEAMRLNPLSLKDLLAQPELDWLDWKADFSPGLMGGKKHELWDEGRAKLLRALVAIANTVYDQLGYVVYGVDNSTTPKTISGITKSFDDAYFQDWAQSTIRPRMEFQYREEGHNGHLLGIFEVRPSSNYPHVIEHAIGGLIYEGQVWFRRGTRCTVAHHEDLQRMFEPAKPIIVNENDGAIVREIRDLQEPFGWEPTWVAVDKKADLLTSGHRMAFLPGSRREIRRAASVLLLRAKRGGA